MTNSQQPTDNSENLTKAIREMKESFDGIAQALHRLGNNRADTGMGAVEGLSLEIQKASTLLAASIKGLSGENVKKSKEAPKRLIRDFGDVAIDTLEDMWMCMAKTVEDSLIESGAEPGVGYTRLDLYQLAQPFALSVFNNNEKMTFVAQGSSYADQP